MIATDAPWANGQVERVNRINTPILSKLIPSLEEWDKVLHKVEFAINNSMNRSTGESPAMLLFGVQQKGEVGDNVRLFLKQDIDKRDLELVRGKASKSIEKVKKYNKKVYDKKHREPHK